MHTFINYLKEEERIHRLEFSPVAMVSGFNEKRDFRVFEHLFFEDGSSMSIQASELHFCYPRLTLNDYSKYKSFEVLIHIKNKNNIIEEFSDEDFEDPFTASSELIEKQFLLLKEKVGLVEI